LPTYYFDKGTKWSWNIKSNLFTSSGRMMGYT
jgi:hypothetical protein